VIHSLRLEAALDERVAAAPADVIQEQTSGDRSERRRSRIERHPRLVLRHHEDEQQVVHFRQRQDGRIQEGDDEESRSTEPERERLNPFGGGGEPVADSPHTMNT
jgi:hypothetical protein